MSKQAQAVTLAGVIVPFLGFLAAIALTWNGLVDGSDLALLAVMYVLSAAGVTVGYHRLLTHRAFRAHRATRLTFAVLGSLSVEGAVLDWVADHRKHHAFTDREGDPHSPHVEHAGGLAGLWYAHMGWLVKTQGLASYERYAKDIYEDRAMRLVSALFPLLVAVSLVLPAAAGFALHGATLEGAIRGLVWAGLVRIFLVHHVTWSINSVCHFSGSRRFATRDRSTNVAWLAIPSLGESWHHNHHTFPRSARHGFRWYELDLSAAIIAVMERLGLAWDVVRVDRDRQAARLAPAGE
ncbi:MAG TPA: acyl-CoA desaturase [Solirubrobacteraceae bacterium]|nr:acyl-CoA desaturase [Solirubrobacteraceae bacterium]